MILRLENQIYQEQMNTRLEPKNLFSRWSFKKPMNILNQLTDEKGKLYCTNTL